MTAKFLLSFHYLDDPTAEHPPIKVTEVRETGGRKIVYCIWETPSFVAGLTLAKVLTEQHSAAGANRVSLSFQPIGDTVPL